MSELHENKDLKLSKSDELPNAKGSVDENKPVDPCCDILSRFGINLDDKNSQKIRQTYNFVDFVYGKSNTERLSKIIDKVVKKDMEFFKDKTDEKITDWQRQKNPDYSFENSLYAQMKVKGHLKLAEPMLWHMILLDILSLKCCDLEPDKPLEESIENAVMQRSNDRLDFLFDDYQLLYHNEEYLGQNIYEYAKQIFKNLPEKSDPNLQQKQLIRKIFVCFAKVAFCKERTPAELGYCAKKEQFYKNHQYPSTIFDVCGLKYYFYLNEGATETGRVIATEEDMVSYLLLTDELEFMFERYGKDFVVFFGYDTSGIFYGGPRFGKFLFFLNKIKPLERRYAEDEARFIEMFFPVTSRRLDDIVSQANSVFYYFRDQKLRSSLIAALENKFDKCGEYCLGEALGKIETQDSIDVKLPWESNNYFCDIIERFADGEKYSNALVEGMSTMLCRNENNVIDIQQSSQKNNSNKLIESPSVNEKKEDHKKTVEYTDLNKDGKSSLNNWIKIENNHKITTKVENKIENGKKNWFFRFVRVVLDFFRSIGSKISSFFCRQPEKIDSVEIKNNSVVEVEVGSQNSKTPKITGSNDKEQKNI